MENAVSDLKAGLKSLGVTKDVVLVSHSIAGEVATNFVHKNPGWVSGAVLVDANVPDFFTDEMLTAFAPLVEQQQVVPRPAHTVRPFHPAPNNRARGDTWGSE